MKKLNHIITVLLLTATCHAHAQTADRDTLFLEESVVVGMDVQKRNTITAAVSTVMADAVSGRPVTDLTHALQGNVPGLRFWIVDSRFQTNYRGNTLKFQK